MHRPERAASANLSLRAAVSPPSASSHGVHSHTPRRRVSVERCQATRSRSALAVPPRFDGLLHHATPGLLHPLADPEVHRVSRDTPSSADDALTSLPSDAPPSRALPVRSSKHRCCHLVLPSRRHLPCVGGRPQGFAPNRTTGRLPRCPAFQRPWLSWASLHSDTIERRSRITPERCVEPESATFTEAKPDVAASSYR